MGEAVSIYLVIACLNAEKTIGETFTSLTKQRQNWDGVFIIDGASSDGTMHLVREFAQLHGAKVTVVSEPDGGIYHAMNKGVRLALESAEDDDLIAVLNADDYYLSDTLEIVREQARQYPDVEVLYGNLELMDARGCPTGVRRTSEPVLPRRPNCFLMPIEHPTMFVRARMYRELGLYDESYRIAGDYEWVLRLIKHQPKTRYIDHSLVLFREGGVSTTLIEESFQEAIRARIAHGSNPLFEYARYGKQKLFESGYRVLAKMPGGRQLGDWLGRSKETRS